MSSVIKPLHSPRLLTATFIALALLVALSPLFAQQASADFVCYATKKCFPGEKNVCQKDCKDPKDNSESTCSPLYLPDTCENYLATIAAEKAKNGGSSWFWQGLFDVSVGFVLKLLNFLLYGLSTVLERLVALSAFLLEMALDVSGAPFSDITILKDGWKIVRDVMNSFFVLILFIIAIATILQLESYAWKQLLPWFIIIALLVNFSFVLSGVVIDFTNVLGRTFFDKLNSPTKLSDNIAKAFDINNINNLAIASCQPNITTATTGVTGTIVSYARGWSCAGSGSVQKLFVAHEEIARTPMKDIDALTKYLFILTLRVIMLFLMIFPLLAGAALMIVRTVMLMILIILAPAAFAAYILPATRTYTNQWYTQLFSLSFFFPSYMFLLYIAINYGIRIGNALKMTGTQLGGTFENLATIFNFLTMVAFMFLALSVARKSGIYGAEMVVKTAGDARKWATGYAGRRTGIPRLSEKLAESGAAQRFAARFPTLGGATLRTLQKGATLGGREAVIKREVDTAMKLAPRYQATAYLKASKPVRRRLEEQMKAEGMAEMMHFTDDQKTRQKIRDTAFASLPAEQRKDSQEKLKMAYGDREGNKQSTGQVVGRFDSKYYTKEEEEKIFDEMKSDRRAKVLMRSTRDIKELEQRMLDGIGRKDVREIERTYDEIARNGIEMDSDTLVQKFNQLSKEANQKLYDIIDPGDLREKMKDFNPGGTSAKTDPEERAKEQAKFDAQKEFLDRISPTSTRVGYNGVPELGLGRNKRGIEIRKIVGAVSPTYWQELGYGSQRELVEQLSPAEAASMREEDMKQAAISQHFDAGQLEAIGRSQRVTPETRKAVRKNIEEWIAAQRAPGPYPPLTPEESARFVRLENYLNTSSAFR